MTNKSDYVIDYALEFPEDVDASMVFVTLEDAGIELRDFDTVPSSQREYYDEVGQT